LVPAGILLCVWSGHPLVAVPAMFLFGCGVVSTFVGVSGTIQRDAPGDRRARVLATFAGTMGLIFTAGVLFTGWLGDRIGIAEAFTAMTTVAAAALSATALVAPHVWRSLSSGDPPSRRAQRLREQAARPSTA